MSRRHCHPKPLAAAGTHSQPRLMDHTPEPPVSVGPLAPEAVDGYVEAVDPPQSKLKLTPNAAEIFAIPLLDVAAKARK